MNMSQVECITDDRIHFQISVTGSVNGDSVQKGVRDSKKRYGQYNFKTGINEFGKAIFDINVRPKPSVFTQYLVRQNTH